MNFFMLCPCCLLNDAADDQALCHLCHEKLSEISLYSEKTAAVAGATRKFHATTSLYKYQPPLRQLIHRAKIRDDIPALRSLVHLLASAPLAIAAGEWATHIVPAPSSLWGRLRGRYDIAWLAANSLALFSKKPMMEVPRHLYWRWRKRARFAREQRRTIELTLIEKNQDSPKNIPDQPKATIPSGDIDELRRFLIVDDVVTTGQTLTQVETALRRIYPGCDVRRLTLATAGARTQATAGARSQQVPTN